MGTQSLEQRPVYRGGKTPTMGLPGSVGSTQRMTMGSLCPGHQILQGRLGHLGLAPGRGKQRGEE